MLQYIYPRLDVNVTISLPHLLKCPFSPHDSTNKICLPFDPTKIDDFDPTTSPDYPTLFEEFHREQNGEEENFHNLEKFRQSLIIFKKFVDNVEKYKFCS